MSVRKDARTLRDQLLLARRETLMERQEEFPKAFRQLLMGIKIGRRAVHTRVNTRLSQQRHSFLSEICRSGWPHPGGTAPRRKKAGA